MHRAHTPQDENQPPRVGKTVTSVAKRPSPRVQHTVSPLIAQAGQLKRKLAGKGAPSPDVAQPPEKRALRASDYDKARDKSLSLALCARIKEAQALQKVRFPTSAPSRTWVNFECFAPQAGLLDEARNVFLEIISDSDLPEAKGKAVYWVARAKFEEV